MGKTKQALLLAQYLIERETNLNNADRADLWVFGALMLKTYLQKPISTVEQLCFDYLKSEGWTEKILARRMYYAKEAQIMHVLAEIESPPVLVCAGEYIHSVVAECQPIPISSPSSPAWFNNMRAAYIAY